MGKVARSPRVYLPWLLWDVLHSGVFSWQRHGITVSCSVCALKNLLHSALFSCPEVDKMTDQEYMALALDLAKRGAGWTSPNPMVGAVIVKDGQIIAQCWHARCGDLHAERASLGQ